MEDCLKNIIFSSFLYYYETNYRQKVEELMNIKISKKFLSQLLEKTLISADIFDEKKHNELIDLCK